MEPSFGFVMSIVIITGIAIVLPPLVPKDPNSKLYQLIDAGRVGLLFFTVGLVLASVFKLY